MSRVSSPRRTFRVNSLSTLLRMTRMISIVPYSLCSMRLPLTAIMLSPGFRPATSAGSPGFISLTVIRSSFALSPEYPIFS